MVVYVTHINPLMAKNSNGVYNGTENHFIESTIPYNPQKLYMKLFPMA